MDEYRWIVSYYPQDCVDDWDLLRNHQRVEFTSEQEARDFAKKQKHKGRPEYWEPSVWKEESYEVTTKHWRPVK